MIERHRVLLPRFGANDEFAVLVEWLVANGDRVSKSDLLARAETSKAVYELEAEFDGFLYQLVEEGESVAVGQPVAVISFRKDNIGSIRKWVQETGTQSGYSDGGPRPARQELTKKALVVARRMKIDVSQIPVTKRKITEADILEFAKECKKPVRDLPTEKSATGRSPSSVERLLIVGGGNAAIQVIDALSRHQQASIILDDDVSVHGSTVMGVPIVDAVRVDRAAELFKSRSFDFAIIAVGALMSFRIRVFNEFIDAGIPFTNVVHPAVFIGMNSVLGAGNVILAFSHIGPFSSIGNNNFFSAYTSIEHHSNVGSHCVFGPCVMTSGQVNIFDRVQMGTGIFIEPRLSIGSDSIVASGVTIVSDVPPNSTVKSRIGYVVRTNT